MSAPIPPNNLTGVVYLTLHDIDTIRLALYDTDLFSARYLYETPSLFRVDRRRLYEHGLRSEPILFPRCLGTRRCCESESHTHSNQETYRAHLKPKRHASAPDRPVDRNGAHKNPNAPRPYAQMQDVYVIHFTNRESYDTISN